MYRIGVNAGVFQVGDPVRVDDQGFLSLADAVADGIIGIVVTVVDTNGKAKDPDSTTLDTWTLSSDNETVAGDLVGFIPALPNYLFYNDADASLTATMELQFMNINAGTAEIDVGTATDSASEQFRLIERDPDGDGDASKGLFQIVESQFGQVSLGPVAQ